MNAPRRLLEHFVNVCDYDRDGEIGYSEARRAPHRTHSTHIRPGLVAHCCCCFCSCCCGSLQLAATAAACCCCRIDLGLSFPWQFARIFTCDDIVQIKKAGAEAEGLVVKGPPKEYMPGVKVDESTNYRAPNRPREGLWHGHTPAYGVTSSQVKCKRKRVAVDADRGFSHRLRFGSRSCAQDTIGVPQCRQQALPIDLPQGLRTLP